jgi:hypothetical protein
VVPYSDKIFFILESQSMIPSLGLRYLIKIDEDFGLLELAKNAGRDAKKRTGILYIVHSIYNTDGQS